MDHPVEVAAAQLLERVGPGPGLLRRGLRACDELRLRALGAPTFRRSRSRSALSDGRRGQTEQQEQEADHGRTEEVEAHAQHVRAAIMNHARDRR